MNGHARALAPTFLLDVNKPSNNGRRRVTPYGRSLQPTSCCGKARGMNTLPKPYIKKRNQSQPLPEPEVQPLQPPSIRLTVRSSDVGAIIYRAYVDPNMLKYL